MVFLFGYFALTWLWNINSSFLFTSKIQFCIYLCWLSCLLMFNGYLILYMSILTRYILCISYLGVTNVFAPTVKLFAIVFWLTRTSMLCTFWTLLVTKLFSSLSTPCEILSLNKCCSVCFAIACFYASKLDLVNWATFVSI